ncbi:metalloregulator ArsR/SmtB family transcription factor [Nigerium sp.]|jgi:ArsR family transcriptional regulator|uniref:ArsR/SmtB family transcription factor n=1 Tax=Nigerium sp. TaxID=2042655 RepID=UPI0032213A52
MMGVQGPVDAPRKEEMPTSGEWETVGGLFRSLGSPIRVGIVVLLTERDHSVNELVDALAVSQPLVSQHLRVLRSGGIVIGERRGREMIYSLTDPEVSDLVKRAARHRGVGSDASSRARS